MNAIREIIELFLRRLADRLAVRRRPVRRPTPMGIYCERCQCVVMPVRDRGDLLCPRCKLVL